MSTDRYRAVLVLGGIRSGKSAYAESLVSSAADVRYVATATTAADDPEWSARLAAHRERRPGHWVTEEIGGDPGRLAGLLAEAKPDQTVLVDDLGGWLTALLGAGPLDEPVDALVTAVRDSSARVVLVSPEVGLSVVPATAAGRAFADGLGTANRALAEVCDGVVLVVAGQPTWLKRSTPGAHTVPVRARPASVGALAVVPVPELAQDDDLAIEPGLSLPLPDQEEVVNATDRLAALDFPGSGLGSLTEVVSFAAGAQGTATPQPFRAVRVLLVHGTHEGGVAAGDGDWARRLREIAEGGGPIGLLAGQAGASVQLVDTGAAGLADAAPVELGDAVTATDVETALRYGWRFDDNAWMVRCAAVRDALHRARAGSRQPKELLAALGGADLAVAVGVLLGAAARRTPVVIDGPVGVAAGLLARDLATQARLWLLLADHGGHPATESGADVLSLTPVAHLGLGEGAAGLAVLPLIQSALVVSTMDTDG